jgi:hypothetical protein
MNQHREKMNSFCSHFFSGRNASDLPLDQLQCDFQSFVLSLSSLSSSPKPLFPSESNTSGQLLSKSDQNQPKPNQDALRQPIK